MASPVQISVSTDRSLKALSVIGALDAIGYQNGRLQTVDELKASANAGGWDLSHLTGSSNAVLLALLVPIYRHYATALAPYMTPSVIMGNAEPAAYVPARQVVEEAFMAIAKALCAAEPVFATKRLSHALASAIGPKGHLRRTNPTIAPFKETSTSFDFLAPLALRTGIFPTFITPDLTTRAIFYIITVLAIDNSGTSYWQIFNNVGSTSASTDSANRRGWELIRNMNPSFLGGRGLPTGDAFATIFDKADKNPSDTVVTFLRTVMSIMPKQIVADPFAQVMLDATQVLESIFGNTNPIDGSLIAWITPHIDYFIDNIPDVTDAWIVGARNNDGSYAGNGLYQYDVYVFLAANNTDYLYSVASQPLSQYLLLARGNLNLVGPAAYTTWAPNATMAARSFQEEFAGKTGILAVKYQNYVMWNRALSISYTVVVEESVTVSKGGIVKLPKLKLYPDIQLNALLDTRDMKFYNMTFSEDLETMMKQEPIVKASYFNTSGKAEPKSMVPKLSKRQQGTSVHIMWDSAKQAYVVVPQADTRDWVKRFQLASHMSRFTINGVYTDIRTTEASQPLQHKLLEMSGIPVNVAAATAVETSVNVIKIPQGNDYVEVRPPLFISNESLPVDRALYRLARSKAEMSGKSLDVYSGLNPDAKRLLQGAARGANLSIDSSRVAVVRDDTTVANLPEEVRPDTVALPSLRATPGFIVGKNGKVKQVAIVNLKNQNEVGQTTETAQSEPTLAKRRGNQSISGRNAIKYVVRA